LLSILDDKGVRIICPNRRSRGREVDFKAERSGSGGGFDARARNLSRGEEALILAEAALDKAKHLRRRRVFIRNSIYLHAK
jgi:hypothetical protein